MHTWTHRTRLARRLACVSVLACVGVLVPSAMALAHPDVDQGVELLHQADFAGALEAFARAAESDRLTREELVTLLRHRMLVHAAMGHKEDMRTDAAQLAQVDPDHVLGEEVLPEVREAFEAEKAKPRIALRVDNQISPTGLHIEAALDHDPAGLVRSVRIGHRVAGGPWAASDGTSVDVSAAPGSRVECFAEALGPGAVVIANAGSRSRPLVRTIPGTDDGEDDDGEGDGKGFPGWGWGLVGGGAAVVVLTAVLATTLGGGDSDGYRVGPPTVDF